MVTKLLLHNVGFERYDKTNRRRAAQPWTTSSILIQSIALFDNLPFGSLQTPPYAADAFVTRTMPITPLHFSASCKFRERTMTAKYPRFRLEAEENKLGATSATPKREIGDSTFGSVDGGV